MSFFSSFFGVGWVEISWKRFTHTRWTIPLNQLTSWKQQNYSFRKPFQKEHQCNNQPEDSWMPWPFSIRPGRPSCEAIDSKVIWLLKGDSWHQQYWLGSWGLLACTKTTLGIFVPASGLTEQMVFWHFLNRLTAFVDGQSALCCDVFNAFLQPLQSTVEKYPIL